jgi:dolichol kinase
MTNLGSFFPFFFFGKRLAGSVGFFVSGSIGFLVLKSIAKGSG